MTHLIDRRDFLAGSSLAITGLTVPGLLSAADKKKLLYKISLTQYSLHRMIGSGKLDNMDFVNRAPATVVEHEKERKKGLLEEHEKLQQLIDMLSDSSS